MTEKKEAFPVKAIAGSGTSSDGKAIFLELEHPTGNRVAFALGANLASGLIDQTALQLDACKKLNPPDRGYVHAFPAQAFAIGSDQDGGDVVLALKFGLGGSITYKLPRQLAEKLHEQIGVELAKSGGESRSDSA